MYLIIQLRSDIIVCNVSARLNFFCTQIFSLRHLAFVFGEFDYFLQFIAVQLPYKQESPYGACFSSTAAAAGGSFPRRQQTLQTFRDTLLSSTFAFLSTRIQRWTRCICSQPAASYAPWTARRGRPQTYR